MFYEVLMEKKAGRYDSLSNASVRGPIGRYILGGALAGGAAGRMSADKDHKTRDMLLGATAGGALGAGASRFHKAIKAHKMKSKGARTHMEYDGRLPDASDLVDHSKIGRFSYDAPTNTGAALHRGHGAPTFAKDSADPMMREAWLKNKDILSMDGTPNDLVHDMGLMRERELLRGGRNLALGAGAGLGLAKLRKRDKEDRN